MGFLELQLTPRHHLQGSAGCPWWVGIITEIWLGAGKLASWMQSDGSGAGGGRAIYCLVSLRERRGLHEDMDRQDVKLHLEPPG